MRRLSIAVDCPVRKNVPAVVDSAHRAMVNYEIFYFSDQRSLERFRQDPLRYCGKLTDPVSRVRFRPSKASPRFTFAGRPYYFASSRTRARFAARPDSFAVRIGS